MKLLLVAVNAKYIHSNLAVYSLRAYAEKYMIQTSDWKQEDKAGGEIGLAEYTINHSEEDILKGIYREQAEIIAFSCYIWNIDIILRVVRELKKVQPEAVIWFGGPEVSYNAPEYLDRYHDIDGIMTGEGEQTFLELAEYYLLGKSTLDKIPGIAYRQAEQQKVVVTPMRQPLDMDALVFPYRDLKEFQNRIIYYESSRGCPYSCSYCLSSIERRVRHRSFSLVKKELQYLLDHQVPQVKFIDRTFNCNKKHAMELWQFIKEKDNGITNFHFEISADLLDEEEIDLLVNLRPGQVQLEIGVQTTNPETVAAIHRRMDLDKLSENVRKIKQGRNIHQHLDLIAGLPLEDYESFERSFEYVYRLSPDQLQLGFLKVLKGSPMEQDSREYGIVYRDVAPYEVLYTNYLSYPEVLKLKGICDMVEIYYNSGQFMHAIRYLEHFYPSPMKLYEALFSYYEESGMNQLAHNRIKRYEILYDYFKDVVLPAIPMKGSSEGEKQLEVFAELLVYDIYLREDRKSRPVFAPAKEQKKGLREIYDRYRREHSQCHIEYFSYDPDATAEAGKPEGEPVAILFDYERRDPISHSAACIPITE